METVEKKIYYLTFLSNLILSVRDKRPAFDGQTYIRTDNAAYRKCCAVLKQNKTKFLEDRSNCQIGKDIINQTNNVDVRRRHLK